MPRAGFHGRGGGATTSDSRTDARVELGTYGCGLHEYIAVCVQESTTAGLRTDE